MRKTILINVLILIVVIIPLASWCEYRAWTLAERAVADQEQRDLDFWRQRLLPVYRDMRVEHKQNPANKAELFDPLVKSLTPLQAK